MKMPNYTDAVVPIEKVTNYLLSFSHPRGSMKAKWFALLGYSYEEPSELAKSLLALANQEVLKSEENSYGTKYVIVGNITGPNGRSAEIATIWMLTTGNSLPKLVTAYPSK